MLSFIALHHYDLFTGEEYFTLQLRREKIPESVQMYLDLLYFSSDFTLFSVNKQNHELSINCIFDHSSCPDLKRYLFNQQLYFYYACYDLIMEYDRDAHTF